MSDSFPDCYRILVEGIELDCLLGVYEHEQRKPRRIGVEVEIHVPVDPRAAHADDLAGTVNYEAIVATVHRIAASRRFKLVESLCSAIIDELAQLPGLRAIRVAVDKPAPMAGMRSVRIEQRRRL
jgi:dihydroneopterin aldolase